VTAVLAVLLAITGIGLDLPPEIVAPAEASAPAERLDPPPSTGGTPAPEPLGSSAVAGGRCVGWEALLTVHSPGWNVERMSRIMYRESRCQPAARNRTSTATGLLQVLASHCSWIAEQLDTACSRNRLTEPEFNVAAAARLWTEQGYRAWSTS